MQIKMVLPKSGSASILKDR